jgi:hypothetical protein
VFVHELALLAVRSWWIVGIAWVSDPSLSSAEGRAKRGGGDGTRFDRMWRVGCGRDESVEECGPE